MLFCECGFEIAPLLVEGVDRQLYLERPTPEEAVEGPLLADRNVLLLGEPGAGKSTLMRQTAVRLSELGHTVAWVNAAPADDPASFLGLVDDALSDEGPREPEITWTLLGKPATLLMAARRLRGPQPATILLDGLLDREIGFAVSGGYATAVGGRAHLAGRGARARFGRVAHAAGQRLLGRRGGDCAV